MGLLTANQVNRKVLWTDDVAAQTVGTYSTSVASQLVDYIILGASLANSDAADQYVEFALFDLLGNLGSLGTVVIPAPVPPSDESVLSLSDPAGDFSLAGLVVPAGWVVKYRSQPGYTTGGVHLLLTLGVA